MAELSSNEDFQGVLTVASNQLKNKKIQVRFGPQGKMRFIIDEDGLKKALAAPTAPSIFEKTFREIFHNEIGPLLEAVIRGVVPQYIESEATQFARRDPTVNEARIATLSARAESVKSLVTVELHARYLIKTSSKHPRLRVFSWEVVRKLALPTAGSIPTPYTTLSFEAVKPEEAGYTYPFWLSLFPESIGRPQSLTFDCDEGDLDDLIQTLQEAKAALGKTTT